MLTIFYPEVASSNTEALRLAKQFSQRPLVLVADRQHSGRGQYGRVWESDSLGGLYYSIVLAPDAFSFEAVDALLLTVAEAVRRVLHDISGLDIDIKLPNDLMILGKKVAGILIQSVSLAQGGGVKQGVIGIGINVNQQTFEGDLADTAVSLFQMSGQSYCKDAIIMALTKELEHVFTRH